ncbi:MAG TPA: amidase [Steroidobacteraceae bacterium]|nr:amidase [Steroidobacteraceae bacterium]
MLHRLAPMTGLLVPLLLIACNARTPPATASRSPHIDVVELTAIQAADLLKQGKLTSRELTQAYLDRIAAIDDAGPQLNAVIDLNPSALNDADALDAERKSGKLRSPLHGLPVLLKDNIDIAGMVNSAGSLALADNRPTRDAFLVSRLRAAGAVILGRTNLSEWANFRSTRSTSGWSSRGGQTKNPYALDRNPCGSSSGTGAAITASLAAIGVGTETDGSIICPSSVTGLVGIKPTVGLVSRNGIIPISISQDTAGPMARSVADAALLLTALAGADADDPAAGAARDRIPADFSDFLRGDALKGKHFGVLRQAMGFHPDVDAAMNKAIAALTAGGATVVDVQLPSYGKWDEPELTVLQYEFKDGLDRYLKAATAPLHSLQDVIAWNNTHAATAMPFFGQELLEQSQQKGPLTDSAYHKARESLRKLAGREVLHTLLDQKKLDALIAPSMSPPWLTDHVLGDHFVGAGYGFAAIAGTPSLTLPIGETHGLPLGLTFMGRAYAEGELIGFGYALEQTLKARRAPLFKATAP